MSDASTERKSADSISADGEQKTVKTHNVTCDVADPLSKYMADANRAGDEAFSKALACAEHGVLDGCSFFFVVFAQTHHSFTLCQQF